MPVIHIVLVKLKQAVLSNGFEELKQKCETLEDLPIAKSKALRIKWGPPAYPGRNEGYNWGECHTLQMQIDQVPAKLTSNSLLLALFFSLSSPIPTIFPTNRSLLSLCLSRRLRGIS